MISRPSALALLLCISFAVSYLQTSAAVSIQENWTFTDNEEEDITEDSEGSGTGSAESEIDHSLGWVQHFKEGDVIFAKSDDIDEITDFIATKSALEDGTVDFASAAPEEMEDGPAIEVNGGKATKEKRSVEEEESKVEPDRGTKEYKSGIIVEPPIHDCREDINGIHHYPEYAVGVLENGCTAFLVGPQHAMTSADCVYDRRLRLWEDKLDFWRGRDDNSYLQEMDWEHVFIPRPYFESGSDEHNWAIITFNKISPVWLSFTYSQKLFSSLVTSYGYHQSRNVNNNVMLSKICEIKPGVQASDKLIQMHCCPELVSALHGGPVFNGYGYDGAKIPKVRGISKRINNWSRYYSEFAVAFGSDTFWSACFLLNKSGYDPQCNKL